MRIFSFFKREVIEKYSIEDRMLTLKKNIPECYHSQRQYENFLSFYDNNEYQLCLESLVELCEETNHYFSIEYWMIIKELAEKMKINSIENYCENQIERNKREINWKLPLGFTTNKIDNKHYETFISKTNTEDWNSKRRISDKVISLKNENGIHNKYKGRNGHLYYVENGKIAEIEYELEVGGFVMFFRNTKKWFYPNEIELSIEEKKKIKEHIINWSKESGNAIIFD